MQFFKLFENIYWGGAFQPGQCGEAPPIRRRLLWAPISLQRSSSFNIWKHLDLDWLVFSTSRFLWFHLAFLLSSREISLSFQCPRLFNIYATKILKMLRSKKIFQSLCENHFRRFVLQARLVQNVSRGQIGCEVAHTSLIELSCLLRLFAKQTWGKATHPFSFSKSFNTTLEIPTQPVLFSKILNWPGTTRGWSPLSANLMIFTWWSILSNEAMCAMLALHNDKVDQTQGGGKCDSGFLSSGITVI